MSRTPTTNAVLVTVDSLRADAVGALGGDAPTPELDRLAREGVVYENAFAGGNWTPFSFPELLGSRPVFAESDDIGLASTPSLAEHLRAAGFRTGGFNAANGFLTPHWGYDRGFEAFDSFVPEASGTCGRYLAAHPTVQAWLQLAGSPFRRAASWLRGGGDGQPFADASRLLDVEEAATAFVRERAAGGDDAEPFFLWVHYMDAHTPYVPAPRYLRAVSGGRLATHRMLLAHARTGLGLEVDERTLADLRTLYAAAVRQVDAGIGRLREALSAAGVADETAIVVAGDHGEEFMEHGHLAHYPKLYDELIHVPLIVHRPGGAPRTDPARAPGTDPAGTPGPDADGASGTGADGASGIDADGAPDEIAAPVGLDAVPPTVCELVGVEPAAGWAGESVLPDPAADDANGGVADQSPVVSVTVRGESVTTQPIPRRLDGGDLLVSARTADWTLIENAATGERELYHRGADPDHQRDLVGTEAAEDAPLAALVGAVDDRATALTGRAGESASEKRAGESGGGRAGESGGDRRDDGQRTGDRRDGGGRADESGDGRAGGDEPGEDEELDGDLAARLDALGYR